jgi:peptidoglycan/xylan/chitin deacetylase (PgdA/CDA1 family)
MLRAILAHTKAPTSFFERVSVTPAEGAKGFFSYDNLRLYGRIGCGAPLPKCTPPLPSVDPHVLVKNGSVELPFDPSEVIDDLRFERYVGAVNSGVSYISNSKSMSRRLYYALRPLFPVAFRRILQRFALQNWSTIPFPNWPVDTTVEDLIRRVWLLALKASGEEQMPFIWYWPRGYESCAIMTHDVETGAGQAFCKRILEIEATYGIRSSFELVPEYRYEISPAVVDAIRSAGGEVCLHGLNHDGRLFTEEREFRRRAELINQYARKWNATGFRSPIMYRNPAWYDAFEFSYDMSFPNVAHLDPQRGGCCTVFPFFIGDVLELPLTTIQDYPLYNIVRADPLAMWRTQMDTILARHGLVSFIIHPDYTLEKRRQDLYGDLLAMMKTYGKERRMWLALPREVDTWWRQRSRMSLSRETGGWTLRGEGSERALVAYAKVEGDELKFVTT